jgi:hypothetical protein
VAEVIIGHLEQAVRRDLKALPENLRWSSLAVAAMKLARRWDAGMPARELAAVSRELRHIMSALDAKAPKKVGTDTADELRARRQRRIHSAGSRS